jgi:hypothetical protein
VRSWIAVAPDLPIIVVDDGGDVSPDLTSYPTVTHIKTDFDIGVSAGRNIGVEAAKTKYVIVADDDNGCSAGSDIGGALSQLVENRLGIVGVGAYWFKESNKVLSITGRSRVAEFTPCDATLNHFIADRELMPRWDSSLKVAGEHVDYFLECRRQGVGVAATPLLDYYYTRRAASKADWQYRGFRRRSYQCAVKAKWGLRRIGRWVVLPEKAP